MTRWGIKKMYYYTPSQQDNQLMYPGPQSSWSGSLFRSIILHSLDGRNGTGTTFFCAQGQQQLSYLYFIITLLAAEVPSGTSDWVEEEEATLWITTAFSVIVSLWSFCLWATSSTSSSTFRGESTRGEGRSGTPSVSEVPLPEILSDGEGQADTARIDTSLKRDNNDHNNNAMFIHNN